MDINTVRVIVTVASFAAFIAILAWALAPSNRSRFDAAARIPQDEEEGQ